MKKSISFILVILMVTCLCACGNSEIHPLPTPTQAFYYEPVEISVQLPTPVPTPAWQPATIRAGYAEVLWDTYNKGDELAVLGEWGDYYIVYKNETELLISNRIVRLNNELPFEPSTGFARMGTLVFETPFFDKKSSQNIELSTNTQVCLLDGKADWVYIEWENGSGYVQTDSISPYYIGSYHDEGGGAGSSSSNGSSGGVDGGDIQLGYRVPQMPKLSLLSAYHGLNYSIYSDCMGTVLCDKAEAYMCVLGYGDMVKVIDISEAECTIYSEGMSATLPRWLVKLDTDASYNQREAFTQHGAKVYREYQLRNVDCTLNRNSKVKIIDELAELNLYVVEVNNSIGYMEIDSVSETEILVYENYYDSSTGSTPESNTVVQEWTAPVL